MNREDLILYRRINYTIIRRWWDAIHGGIGVQRIKNNENDKNSLLSMFMISRDKLNNLTGGYTGQIKMESISEQMQNRTGIDKDFFYGSRPLSIEGITVADWKNYFEKKNQYIGNDRKYPNDDSGQQRRDPNFKRGDKPKEVSDFESRLFTMLKEMEPDRIKNRELYYLKYYIKHGECFFGTSSKAKLIEVTEQLKQITIKDLEELDGPEIKEYIKAISLQKMIATSVLIYNKHNKAQRRAKETP